MRCTHAGAQLAALPKSDVQMPAWCGADLHSEHVVSVSNRILMWNHTLLSCSDFDAARGMRGGDSNAPLQHLNPSQRQRRVASRLIEFMGCSFGESAICDHQRDHRLAMQLYGERTARKVDAGVDKNKFIAAAERDPCNWPVWVGLGGFQAA